MMKRWVLLMGAAALAACSSGAQQANGDGGGGADTGATADSGPPPCPKKYGTLVVVGDSISDVGSGSQLDKQQPFYRELLVTNDDAKYPDWKGKDLTKCWDAPNVVKVSKGGAVATEGGSASVLFDQVKSLPASLPGPVLVVGTIGGNDLQKVLPKVVLNQDVTADMAAFRKGLDDAFGEITKTDRFGAGVKVDALITNIYDPSGGTGNFAFTGGTKCPGVLAYFPANTPTDPLLAPWNAAMTEEAAKYAGVKILDLHAAFKDHGAPATETWFFTDCIHPNAAGHEHLRELFWSPMLSL